MMTNVPVESWYVTERCENHSWRDCDGFSLNQSAPETQQVTV